MGIFTRMFETTQEDLDGIEAVWALRDMHIAASIAGDSATAKLANLLIQPTPKEFYVSVNGVTVDISSPEYAAWYHEHYG